MTNEERREVLRKDKAECHRFAEEEGGSEALFWAGRMSWAAGALLRSTPVEVGYPAALLAEYSRLYDEAMMTDTARKVARRIAAKKAARVWDLAGIEWKSKSVAARSNADLGAWYAWAPNGVGGMHRAEDEDPATAVSKVLAMVAEDLRDWEGGDGWGDE